MLAADYPFLEIFWTMVLFFTWVAWIWVLITIFADVFRRSDIGGFAKAAWCVFVIFLPFIGVLVYLIAQHNGMMERNLAQAETAKRQFDQRVQAAAASSGGGAASQIEKAQQVLQSGAIDQSEFATLKAKALGAA